MKTIDVNAIQLSIESPGIHIEDKFHNSLIMQLEKLSKFYSRITKCEMVLRVEKNSEKNNCLIETRLFIPGKIFFIKQQEPDFYKSADKMFNDLRDQLLRHKEKNQS